ncbi:hypothetical protein [Labilithrix luteola]|nr:hypothetical protein [Labilithrix luteola]
MPLASNSINMAGQPSKVGGTVARVFGWLVLLGGLVVGFGTLAACGAIVGFASAAPYIIGIPIAVVSLIAGWFLLKSGKDLQDSGVQTEKATRMQALFALANTRGGVLTPMDAAQSLGVTPQEGDAILTSLAKEQPDYVAVDIDDNGNLLYRFLAANWHAVTSKQPPQPAYARVDMTPNARVVPNPDVRVSDRSAELEEEEASFDPAGVRRQTR